MIQSRKKALLVSERALVLGFLLVALVAASLLVARPAAAAPAEALTWGDSEWGQLGNGAHGPFASSSTPVSVSNLSGVKRVDGGHWHSLALKEDGTVSAWGDDEFGQLGDVTDHNLYSDTPVSVSNLDEVKSISAGRAHSLALKEGGTVWAWGDNEYGQLGDGTDTQRPTPVQVENLTGVKAIAAGDYHSLALKKNGTVWAWGDNTTSQLGTGTTGGQSVTPVRVQNLANVKAIAANSYYSLALKENGTVFAWGMNSSGQLGNGTTGGESATPVRVGNLTKVKAIAAGSFHALALKENSTVFAWGSNGFGQLGTWTNVGQVIPTPVQVQVKYFYTSVPLTGVKAIAAGRSHSLALKKDGRMMAWGRNDFGQLGDGTEAPRYSAVLVRTADGGVLSGVEAIGAGDNHSLAVKQ